MSEFVKTQPAQITKAQITPLGECIGKHDVDTGLRFAGFAGGLNKADGLYHGELRWLDPTGDETDSFSVSSMITAATQEEPEGA